MRIRHLATFCCLCVITAPVFAGLFNDDEARQQIQQLEAKLAASDALAVKLEARLSITESSLGKVEAAYKQQSGAMLDLQMLLETQNLELRKLRGQNEVLAHGLQDAEKRQKDFYVDLDGRLRRFEAVDAAVAEKVGGGKNKTDDPGTENRALEAAFGFYKAERYQNALVAFQDFLNSYPQSPHVPNIRYWMGNAYFVLKDYKASLENYQLLVTKFETHAKVSEAMFSMADCQELLGQKEAAKTTLKQIVAKFPNSENSTKAKKRLSTLK